jgi:hypothetical protein
MPFQRRSEQKITISLFVFTVIQLLRLLAEDAEILVIISGHRTKFFIQAESSSTKLLHFSISVLWVETYLHGGHRRNVRIPFR